MQLMNGIIYPTKHPIKDGLNLTAVSSVFISKPFNHIPTDTDSQGVRRPRETSHVGAFRSTKSKPRDKLLN